MGQTDDGRAVATREQLVSEAFVALADTLVDDYDVIELLERLVGYSVTLLAADAAGLLLGDRHRELRLVTASSQDARVLEMLQLQAAEGPCIDCYRTGRPVSVPDLNELAVERWPAFVAAAAEMGVFASVHALPLRLRGEAIGALNLLHRTPGALPAADLSLGQALADVATIGILQERAIRRGEVLNEQLQVALDGRVVIEQAKGVIAHHTGEGMDAAFDMLRRFARDRSVRLVEIARQVVEGELDAETLRRSASPARRSGRRYT
jgi:transcriptional regulator with GAF, ATPase, and Fis domain